MSQSVYVSSDVDEWGDGEFAEVYRRIGLSLMQSHGDDSIYEAAYSVAEQIVGGPGERAVALGDDIVNSDSFRNGLYDRLDGHLVWMSWDGPPGGSDGLSVLDLGSDKLIACCPPSEDAQRSSWQVGDTFDRDDQEQRRRITLDYLSQGLLSQNLFVDPNASREDIFVTLKEALDGGWNADWQSLQLMMESESDVAADTETDHARSALLDAYLDWSLERR